MDKLKELERRIMAKIDYYENNDVEGDYETVFMVSAFLQIMDLIEALEAEND